MGKKGTNFVQFDHEGIHVGSKLYIGKDLDAEDLMGIPYKDGFIDKRYACLVKHYSNEKTRTVYCNNRKFRVAIYGKNKEYKALPRSELDPASSDEKLIIEEGRVRTDNVKRATDRIFEIVHLNIKTFSVFVTITFNDKKVDARNASEVMAKLGNWLSNQVQRRGLKYLLVPELHKSGRIHAHVLCNNVFDLVDSGTRIVEGFDDPIKLSTIKRYGISSDRIKAVVYNIPEWRKGFTTAILTYGDGVALGNYVSKYLTKDTAKIFGRRYWCSRNLTMYPVYELVDFNPNLFNALPYPTRYSSWSDDEYKYTDNMRRRIE